MIHEWMENIRRMENVSYFGSRMLSRTKKSEVNCIESHGGASPTDND